MPKFRPNVCIVVQKADSRQILLCHRLGYPKESGWQLPQGGIDIEKDLISEMRRELVEEIGTDDVKVISISAKKYSYFFPKSHPKSKKYDGQLQTWVLTEFSGSQNVINFNKQPAEFDAYIWTDVQTVLDRIVDFKKQVYKEALHDLGLLK
jgi:putative (di)nucleoside polyphosphate hydrolase